MRLTDLSLFGYRNLDDQTVAFHEGVNLFVGLNGQGKTNLIEAIGILSSTKSFRQSGPDEVARWGERAFSVFGTVQDEHCFRLGAVFDRGERQLFVDDEKTTSVDQYLGKLTTMVFTPLDLLVVKGPPSGRRRFLDKATVDCDTSRLRILLEYGYALKCKNRILREGIQDPKLLEPWNAILARAGSEIIRVRDELLAMISPRAEEFLREISGQRERLELKNASGFSGSPADFTEGTLRGIFGSMASREISRGSSLVGPHRGDLEILLNGQEARLYASQGQAKSIVLALKLAALELVERSRGSSPIVLLDDVDSELDARRRETIRTLLLETGRQVFITGTEAYESEQLFGRGLHHYRVDAGRITEGPPKSEKIGEFSSL